MIKVSIKFEEVAERKGTNTDCKDLDTQYSYDTANEAAKEAALNGAEAVLFGYRNPKNKGKKAWTVESRAVRCEIQDEEGNVFDTFLGERRILWSDAGGRWQTSWQLVSKCKW